MRAVDCVGALIRDERQRVYVQRRTAQRRLLPGIWDIVGGHLEAGESPEQALAREVEEETGWRVRSIDATVADWEWEYEGRVRREVDYLVTIDGDLRQPRLEDGKHDASAWVGPDDLDLLMVNRTDGDRRLRDIVALANRIRFTARLRLEPISGPTPVLTGHVADLERLHGDPWVAEWYAGTWSTAEAVRRAAAFQARWESNGVSKWMAYDRASGALVGRGGMDRLDPDHEWVRQIAEVLDDGGAWAAERLELGWALRTEFRGQGLAAEIGRAGLDFAFGALAARSVIALTERHNLASRAVMERIGMKYAGEIRTEGLVENKEGLHPDAPFAVYETTA
ncbi:GNAT family N-acetyltransferase [Kribbella qitaiheensis]|uniref:GNAT family N-acetyltransferase n=1 Tax=Kribbella qitaiheensis TaxID=1544730 RepID=UPI001629E8B0|nr:GNAT family N-acetyltransferase [Kribbella qitaiheensis]